MGELLMIKFIVPSVLFLLSFILKLFDKDGWWVFLLVGFILFGIGVERLG